MAKKVVIRRFYRVYGIHSRIYGFTEHTMNTTLTGKGGLKA